MLIVFDGIDGSGKSIQFNRAVAHLKNSGHAVETSDFPRYGQKSAGLVEEYLIGLYGTSEEVGPYRASIFYAADRYAASKRIQNWLNDKKIVVCNRYVASNMGHQGSKIPDPAERAKFFAWNDDLEHNIFGIPRPDINFFLHVPAEKSIELIKQKAERDYLKGGAKDIHEGDIEHLKKAENTYLEITKTFPNFVLIECVEENRLLTVDEIHTKVWNIIISKINCPQ